MSTEEKEKEKKCRGNYIDINLLRQSSKGACNTPTATFTFKGLTTR